MTYSWVEAYSNSVLLLSGTDPMTLPQLMASTICTSRAIRHSVILCCGKRWSDISKPRTPSLCPSLVSSCGVQSHQPKTLSSSAIKHPPIKAFFSLLLYPFINLPCHFSQIARIKIHDHSIMAPAVFLSKTRAMWRKPGNSVLCCCVHISSSFPLCEPRSLQ